MLDRNELQAYLDSHNIMCGVVIADNLREWRGWLLYDYDGTVCTGLQQLTDGSLIVAHDMSEDSRMIPTALREDSLAAHFYSLWHMHAQITVDNWLWSVHNLKQGDLVYEQQQLLYKQRTELFYANWKAALRWELS